MSLLADVLCVSCVSVDRGLISFSPLIRVCFPISSPFAFCLFPSYILFLYPLLIVGNDTAMGGAALGALDETPFDQIFVGKTLLKVVWFPESQIVQIVQIVHPIVVLSFVVYIQTTKDHQWIGE